MRPAKWHSPFLIINLGGSRQDIVMRRSVILTLLVLL